MTPDGFDSVFTYLSNFLGREIVSIWEDNPSNNYTLKKYMKQIGSNKVELIKKVNLAREFIMEDQVIDQF